MFSLYWVEKKTNQPNKPFLYPPPQKKSSSYRKELHLESAEKVTIFSSCTQTQPEPEGLRREAGTQLSISGTAPLEMAAPAILQIREKPPHAPPALGRMGSSRRG